MGENYKMYVIFLSSFDKKEKGGTLRSSLKTNQISRACYQNTVNSRSSAVLGGTGTTSIDSPDDLRSGGK